MARSLCALIAFLTLSGAAQAAQYTVTFTDGPPLGQSINDEYRSTAFVRFFQADGGFRPARRAITANNVAADIGAERCNPDNPGSSGNGCEVYAGGTTFNLTRSATSVSVDLGMFTPGALDVRLVAYALGNPNPVAMSPLVHTAYDDGPVNAPRAGPGGTVGGDRTFHDTITVSHAAGDIQRVELVVPDYSTTGELGFDNLKVDVPAGQTPDVAVSLPPSTVVVPQGASVDVPVTMTRVNGSDGALSGAVSGLPPGVTATLTPNPVTGTGETATLHLAATAAAPANFAGTVATLTYTPATADVAPATRAATVRISVRSQFDLTGPGDVQKVPPCAPLDVPLKVEREAGFATDRTVTLSVSNVPSGVTATFPGGTTVPPGGGLNAPVTLRITHDTRAGIVNTQLVVTATAPGAPTRTLTVRVDPAPESYAIDSTTLRGSPPSRLKPGSRIRLVGNGFCPGTTLTVGNDKATVAADKLTPDPAAPTTATSFELPRLATSGPVRVTQPGNAQTAVETTNLLKVDNPRNVTGFQFDNPDWGNFSFDEFVERFGADEIFFRVNPCSPWGDCSFPTGIPNPSAFAKWQAIEYAAQASGGHCFGDVQFAQQVLSGRITTRQFSQDATSIFSLPGPNGPDGKLGSYLDVQHVGQFSSEFLGTALRAITTTLPYQLERVRLELAAGRLPGVVIFTSIDKGHVVLVHDIQTLEGGATRLWLVDNEHPFTPGEETDTTGAKHEAGEDAGKITINPAKTEWTYNSWKGGDGHLFVTTVDDVPTGGAASLPGLGGILRAVVFGSDDGSATLKAAPDGTTVIPVLDERAVPGAAGTVLSTGDGPIESVMQGSKDGTYEQTFMGDGSVSVVHATTAAGVQDRVGLDGGTAEFAGGKDGPLELKVGTDDGRMATLDTEASQGGADHATLTGDTLAYAHVGAPTTVTVGLESVTEKAGAAALKTRVRVGRGETLTVRPASWATLRSARVVVRERGGLHRATTVRGTALKARVALRGLAVTDAGRAKVTLRVLRVPENAIAGVTLRLFDGSRVVARHAFGLPDLAKSTRRVGFKLPARLHGRFRLRADVKVQAAGTATGSRHVTRTVPVTL